MSQTRSHQSPDPPRALRGRCEQDARRFAARLEPDRAPLPSGGGAERPPRADRRRRVRQPEHLRGPDPDAELHTDGRGRTALQPVPRDGAVLPDPRRAPHRQEQPRGGVRLDRRVRGRVPRLFRDPSEGLRAAAADPAGQRLQHGGVRQVAPDAGRATRPGRAVRPLAERLGVRLLLRDPRRRLEPMGPVPGREPEDHRDAGERSTTRTIRTTSRTPWPTAPSSGSTGSARRTLASRSSSTTRPAAATLRITSRRSGPTSTRASSTKDGTGFARRPSLVRRSSASSPPTPS